MSFNEVKDLRKSGKLKEALEMAQEDLKADPDNVWNKRSISWVYYDLLKTDINEDSFPFAIFQNILDLNLEDEDFYFDKLAWQIAKLIFAKSRNSDSDKQRQILKIWVQVKQMPFPKVEQSVSILFKSFHRIFKNDLHVDGNYLNLRHQYLELFKWFNPENFNSEDYQKSSFKGNNIMALVEQAVITYSKRLLEKDDEETQQFIDEFMPFLDEVIENHSEFQYPTYYKAKLLLQINQLEEARKFLLPFVKTKKNEFWTWELLSNTFDKNSDEHLSCLCKALVLKTNEEFLVGVRESMAESFLRNDLKSNAKSEIESIKETRENKGWKIPDSLLQLQNSFNYSETISADNNEDFYKNNCGMAEELLFGDIPTEFVIVEFVNSDKKILNFIKDTNEDGFGFFKYENILKKPKIGDVLKIKKQKISENGFSKVFKVENKGSDLKLLYEIPAFEIKMDKLRIPTGKSFGFVEDVFVPPDIIKEENLSDGDSLDCRTMLNFDKTKNEWGQKAFEVKRVES